MADTPGMFDGADTVVLYEELAFQDVLPVVWRSSPGPLDPEAAASLAERNLQVLQAWDAMGEHGPVEKPDENSPYAADLMRMERKMNLLLDLVGQILASSRPRPAPAYVRFNALGAVWRGTAPLPEAGAQGILEVHLHDCLAQPLRLPGRVTNVTPDGNVKARFLPLGETIADLIEKMAFRRHRRQIAGTRTVRTLNPPK
ncbi:MAG: PilZ domain-containing protein [Gammaproteobacteria bacterium]|nr:PilZ domain-containing protein [Gammaproteobacteria bacterium]